MVRDLINAVAVRWLDEKCQRLLATALKVQHCWTLKTTVGDCWRQSLTCAGDSRQLKYKHKRDCRRLSPSRATASDWSINQALLTHARMLAKGVPVVIFQLFGTKMFYLKQHFLIKWISRGFVGVTRHWWFEISYIDGWRTEVTSFLH